MQLIIEFQADHLIRALQAARREVEAPREMLLAIGESLLRVNKERHDAGLAPDGTKWKELAASTLAEGKRKGGPLCKTGRMLTSFQYQVGDSSLRLFFDGNRDGKLADIHHSGSGPYDITAKKGQALKFGGLFRKRVHHPGLTPRPLVGFTESDQLLTAHVSADHLMAVLKSVR
jgi:phage gpG-like protein